MLPKTSPFWCFWTARAASQFQNRSLPLLRPKLLTCFPILLALLLWTRKQTDQPSPKKGSSTTRRPTCCLFLIRLPQLLVRLLAVFCAYDSIVHLEGLKHKIASEAYPDETITALTSILTGATASKHGIVGDAWLQRESGRNFECLLWF